MYEVLRVDRKGRVLVPKELREELEMESEVIAEKRGKTLVLKPVEKIGDPIKFLASFRIKSKKTPVEMKHEAQEKLFED